MSPVRLRLNTTLPAPIMATLITAVPPSASSPGVNPPGRDGKPGGGRLTAAGGRPTMPGLTAVDPPPAALVRVATGPGRGWARWFWPAVLVVAAVAVRAPHLAAHGYTVDELWTAELAVGRGSPHAALPLDRVVPAPPLTRPPDPPPAWRVWSHMGATHPPLYWVVLRLWQDVFGRGDGRERALSVVASAAAVAVLYDAVRERAGVGPAVWAGALLAVAGPQVENARLTRGYSLLVAALAVVAAGVARTEVRGPSRPRWLAVAGGATAALLTHYFAAGALAAVAVYAGAFTRGPVRRSLLRAGAAAAVVFAVTWLPFVPGQMHLFRPDDPATDFLRHDRTDHLWHTLGRVVLAPVSALLTPSTASTPFAAAGVVLYAAPLLAAAAGRRPPGGGPRGGNGRPGPGWCSGGCGCAGRSACWRPWT